MLPFGSFMASGCSRFLASSPGLLGPRSTRTSRVRVVGPSPASTASGRTASFSSVPRATRKLPPERLEALPDLKKLEHLHASGDWAHTKTVALQVLGRLQASYALGDLEKVRSELTNVCYYLGVANLNLGQTAKAKYYLRHSLFRTQPRPYPAGEDIKEHENMDLGTLKPYKIMDRNTISSLAAALVAENRAQDALALLTGFSQSLAEQRRKVAASYLTTLHLQTAELRALCGDKDGAARLVESTVRNFLANRDAMKKKGTPPIIMAEIHMHSARCLEPFNARQADSLREDAREIIMGLLSWHNKRGSTGERLDVYTTSLNAFKEETVAAVSKRWTAKVVSKKEKP